MSTESRKQIVTTAILVTSGVGLFYLLVRNKFSIYNKIKNICNFSKPLKTQSIRIVNTSEDCKNVCEGLLTHCKEYGVLGFDCEWVTVGGSPRPVALLQLASHRGLCALIRLCNLQKVPICLRELLENEDILKVGVAPADDASRLSYAYGVGVASTFDLRFLALQVNEKPEGLAKLSKNLINIELDKNWKIRCSDWEAKTLSNVQIEYAAKDAQVAVEIFKKLSHKLHNKYFWQSEKFIWDKIKNSCEPFIDIRFKDSMVNNWQKIAISTQSLQTYNKKRYGFTKKPLSRSMCTRSKQLYDNCLLEAPDGELLCTCDKKKAQWYIDQNLGELYSLEPFTVRLNFEPAGRAVGEVGKYYTLTKENQCVVCGSQDGYIRKNVVPREYRKHFPVVMKSHTSHDVLLLCLQCHQISNISDLKIRQYLSQKCDAPLRENRNVIKSEELQRLRQLKSAARAILYNSHRIPKKRLIELQDIILKNVDKNDMNLCSTELTGELLQKYADLRVDNAENLEHHYSHGLKVVTEFQEKFGGLIELEKIWREHFLKTMQPKYLPELWSVTHNANRLEIRANEGRIDKKDMALAGIDR